MGITTFKSKEYPHKLINFPFGERKISIEELNSKLMTYDGDYESKTAQVIDEGIFYYVTKEVFQMNESEIVKTIMSEI